MQPHQHDFIAFCLENQVLRFGEFTLKSGRKSPYFFNAGLFNTGSTLAKLGQFYASAIIHYGLKFDMLFGPAYKGIPLVSACAIALAEQHDLNYAYAFNRKETKDHGEGGLIVGHALSGDVLIVDDVITAGTAIRQSLEIIHGANAKPAGIIVAMDRQEKGLTELSAIQDIEKNDHIPVVSIITLSDLLNYVRGKMEFKPFLSALNSYRDQYGVQT